MPYKDKEKQKQYRLEHREHYKKLAKEWREKKKQNPFWVKEERARVRLWKQKHKPKRKYNPIPKKERRRIHKLKIVELLGGKCSKCGYSKCIYALDLHEIEKINGTTPTILLRSYRGFKLLLENLDKLKLLCKNCHTELHHLTPDEPQVAKE